MADQNHKRRPFARSRRGFTLTETVVVVGAIALLAALLVPALRGVFSTGKMATSMSRMRQVSLWMSSYSSDHKDIIVPSYFDYSGFTHPGKVRSANPPASGLGDPNQGTWADILWTGYADAVIAEGAGGEYSGYRYEVPATDFYEVQPNFENPFRSDAFVSRNLTAADGLPTPYGPGALDKGEPGFFAANNFFNMQNPLDPGSRDGFWKNAQLRNPSKSVYLVDSIAGYTIEPTLDAWDDPLAETFEVDFRYANSCLILRLDGSAESVLQWEELDTVDGHPNRLEIEGNRITELTLR